MRSRELSGRMIVIGLLILGVAATALMFVYWEQHTRPFRVLREAIGREFRHSRPSVEGGRQKGRGAWTLRISMSVNFPPAEDPQKAAPVFARVQEIIREKQDLTNIENVEINLIQFIPQEHAKTKMLTLTVEELKSGKSAGEINPATPDAGLSPK